MTIDVTRLPRVVLPVGATLYRIHKVAYGAWFFDGSSDGRFNPAGTPGRGACYWADDELGAWVEVFRTRLTLTDEDLEQRCISAVRVEAPVPIADLAGRAALAAGVTAALAAGHDYQAAQDLADELQVSRLKGVRWRLRHDPAQQLLGLAWFGPEGQQDDPAAVGLPVPARHPISPDLVARARNEFGYEVLPDLR